MGQTAALKIIFAGTPAFAKTALAALINSRHSIVAVYTQPDKPSGRGLKLTPSPVKQLALQNHLAVYQPLTLKDGEQQEILYQFNADIMVVAAYGMILPAAVLSCTKFGCINIHPSLLPRWRGAAPIQRTIYTGDTLTGVSIMQLDEGLDTGPIIMQMPYPLTGNETSQILHDALAELGAFALLQTLEQFAAGVIDKQEQDNYLATYAKKITKQEARIDWHKPAATLEREIRAFNPWPVSHSTWQDKQLRIWYAKEIAAETKLSPGTIVAASQAGIDIATGKGILRLLQLQLPGGKQMPVAEFYNARQHELLPHTLFE